jgi:hypothetical protein
MADQFDQASDAEMRDREAVMAAQLARAAAMPKLKPKGECYNPRCCEAFADDSQQLFCGPKCSQQYSIFKR